MSQRTKSRATEVSTSGVYDFVESARYNVRPKIGQATVPITVGIPPDRVEIVAGVRSKMTAIPILTVLLDPNLFLAMTATISAATELNRIAEIIRDVSASMTLKIILIKQIVIKQ